MLRAFASWLWHFVMPYYTVYYDHRHAITRERIGPDQRLGWTYKQRFKDYMDAVRFSQHLETKGYRTTVV